MASFGTDPFEINILAVEDLIGSGINKVNSPVGASPEGTTTEKIDVLDFPMEDEELLKLRDEWEKRYSPYEKGISAVFKQNLRSYLGREQDASVPDYDKPLAGNLQFEAEETFLAAALAQEPDPVVYCDNTPEGNAIADSVRTMLQFHADQLILRRKMMIMVRQWSIYQLAVLKHGWDEKINDVCIENRKIQDFVFDPDGYVDTYGDFTSWLGERISVTAEELIKLFPKHEEYIKLKVTIAGEAKLGTICTYTEWWTDDYCFSTFKDKVLDKHKNQYFIYEEPEKDDGQVEIAPVEKTRRNHFAQPKKPYTFLSIFSLQGRPHDITGLIEQNIPNQEKVFKRTEQLDSNLSQSNNGLAFSENNFTQETAKQAANALTNGVGKVLIPPGGPIGEALVRIPAPNIPDGFFKELEKNEGHLRSSWGVQGLAAQPPQEDQTARGMILNQAHDTSRIGGGIGDALDQVARNVFNWLVQLYLVFYDEKHFAAVMGTGKAVQYVTLSSMDMQRQLIVSVSPNSTKPKDEISQMNMAQALFDKGAIGPKTLLDNLEFPNADDAAADGLLYKMNSQLYMQLNFPEMFEEMQQAMMPQAPAPGGVPAQGGSLPQVPPSIPVAPSATAASAALSNVPLPK